MVFDGDAAWLEHVLALGWELVYVRSLGSLQAVAALSPGTAYALEYPLQGLNAGAAGVAAGLTGRPPAAVVVSPELSLEEIQTLAAELHGLSAAGTPAPAPRDTRVRASAGHGDA